MSQAFRIHDRSQRNYPNGDSSETNAWHKWLSQKYGNPAALGMRGAFHRRNSLVSIPFLCRPSQTFVSNVTEIQTRFAHLITTYSRRNVQRVGAVDGVAYSIDRKSPAC